MVSPADNGVQSSQLLDAFRRYLRERNLPVTAQRELVADVIFTAAGHLSVDDILARLRERGAHVGTATVYRTLDLLAESGMIEQRDFGEGFRRYERMRGGGVQHHEHLICVRCGKVIEFSNERLERMKALIAEEYGFRHHHHRLEIFGTCPECQQAPSPSRPR
jgi:Fur family transcriptional regulator, ferric uptake regulator